MDKRRIIIIIAAGLAVLAVLMAAANIIVRRSQHKLEMTAQRIDAIYEYARLQKDQGDQARAARAFEIIAKEKDAGEKQKLALLNLAGIYEKEKDLVKAREQYIRLIRAFPASEEISHAQKRVEEINMALLFSRVDTADSIRYVIRENDTLGKIASRFGTTVELIKKSNGLKNDIIIPGKTLKVHNAKFSILVDKSQNLLFLKQDGEVLKTYTVSTGQDNCTPVGTFKVEEKMVSPVWYKIGAVVSPDNEEYELGTRWMGLSVEGYGIHGTRDPGTIGRQITKGCVRMLNSQVEELFVIVPSGTEVVIVD